MKTHFKRLRKKLPHRYTAVISERVPGVSPRQVKGVFTGEIKNPDVVDPVIREAIKLSKQYDTRKLNIIRKLKTATSRKITNKRAA